MCNLEIKEKVSKNKQFASLVQQKKQEMIDTAIAWRGNAEKGSYEYYEIWESDDKCNKVCLGKFGKEYYLSSIKWKSGTLGNNPNDMKPTIFVDGKAIEFDASFDHVFNLFQQISKVSEEALRVLGCLLFRNAYLLDHKNVNGTLRYCPPKEAIEFIMSRFSTYDGISLETYIHYLEAIAWNEDVKYYTLGYEVHKQGIGRTNNMKTYANVISVLLGVTPVTKLCSSFSRPPVGVAPITFEAAKTAFPQLNLD